ncbi:MAG: cation:proton antiporter [Actinomycetaceae bacterium]|nr:cation:proton antiporter [Actinomycetaceae bacterium]
MTEFISLFTIAVIALLAPLISHLIPRNAIPEVVLLVGAGVVVGPNVLGLVHLSGSLSLLSELGLAFLFMLAGYEIEVAQVKGPRGRIALGAWIASFALAALAVFLLPLVEFDTFQGAAIAISLTATALGTLIPILKERGILRSPVGLMVTAHGIVGEIAPILAMALLLSFRSTAETLAVIGAFILISVVIATVPVQARKFGSRLLALIHMKAQTTAQTTVRLTVVVLVGLVTLADIFALDVVLGAFAAGFIVRTAVPDGREELEEKLDGLAYGFMIPLFFVTSGAAIDPAAVGEQPLALVGFVVLLLGVRAIPVFVSTYLPSIRDDFTSRERVTVALYATTSLPIIVAVTHVATAAEAMSETVASILVSAGALSVLLMPMLAAISGAAADAHPIQRALSQMRRLGGSRTSGVSKTAANTMRKRGNTKSTRTAEGSKSAQASSRVQTQSSTPGTKTGSASGTKPRSSAAPKVSSPLSRGKRPSKDVNADKSS